MTIPGLEVSLGPIRLLLPFNDIGPGHSHSGTGKEAGRGGEGGSEREKGDKGRE